MIQNIFFVDFSFTERALGGSAFAQSINKLGKNAPTVTSSAKFKNAFNTIQKLIEQDLILAGHDISSGGLITTLLEMCFAENNLGAKIDLSKLNVKGGSLAIGHPFAATGARIIGTLAKLLAEKGSGRGLISVCTAGGMGVTAILEAA